MYMCKMHGVSLGRIAFILLAGCSRNDTPGTAATPSAVPTEAPTITITGTPQPSASASASATPSALASASASAKPSASARSAPVGAPPSEPALKPASTRISGKNFTLDVASPGCRVDTPCAVTLRLVAVGEYHVNKEYPYKFIAGAAPGVQFLGNGEANIFSRAGGDFREDGEKAATMTVRFKPTVVGEASVSGKYKMSVCSAEQCQIETQAVQLAVLVM